MHEKTIHDIETSLERDYGCYYCFIFLELILSVVGIISFLATQNSNANTLSIALQVLVTVIILVACGAVLSSKESLESNTQQIGLIAFYLGFFLNLALTIIALSGNSDSNLWNSQNSSSIDLCTIRALTFCMIPICLIIYGYILVTSHKVLQMMEEREKLRKSSNNMNQGFLV